MIQQPCFLPLGFISFLEQTCTTWYFNWKKKKKKKIKHLYLNFYLFFFFPFKINAYLNASVTITPYRLTFWLMQSALPHFTESYLSTGSTQSTILCFKAVFLLAFPPPSFLLGYSPLSPLEVTFPRWSSGGLQDYSAETPVPEAQLQGFGSQRVSPSLSSALRAHVAAERASSVGSGEWGNFLFSFLISPAGVPGLLPFPSVHRKTCQKDQAPGLKEFTKENWKQTSDPLRLWPETETTLQQPCVFNPGPTASRTASGAAAFLSPSQV